MNANPALRTSRAGSSAIVAELKPREGSALCASSIAQSKMSRIMQAGPADALGCASGGQRISTQPAYGTLRIGALRSGFYMPRSNGHWPPLE